MRISVEAAPLFATLIITNADVRTMDENRPDAQAIAIFGEKVVQIGGNPEIANLRGPKTQVIDAGGRLLLPGFNDAHVHFLSGGFQLASVDLRDAATLEEFSRRIAQFATNVPKGRWITRGNWDHERWAGAPLPTKEMIDRATTNVPVFVSRLDGHMALANSLALKLANVTGETKDPPGGLIVRDAKGEPTGLLKDAAMSLVQRVIPEPKFEEKMEAAKAATEQAARLGVTSVQDMSAEADVAVYQSLHAAGKLKTRIYAVWPLPRWHELAKTGVRAGFGDPMLRVGGLKGFSDGSLGSTTALFFEPYADSPNTSGLPADEMFPEGAMLQRVREADAAGLQVMVHAIGDKANDGMLRIFEEVALTNGVRDRRFRIEHAQHLRFADVPRFARGNIIASMQPYHAADDGRWAEKRIGIERCKGTYAFRALLDNEVILAFGTDWPVAPLDPLQGIAAAVTRQTLDGKHPNGWIPEQKISVEEAVRAYTHGSAFAEFTEKQKGTIAVGKLADIVILTKNILEVAPTEIEKASVWMTVVDGKVVYRAEP